jgi:hypothetical protein
MDAIATWVSSVTAIVLLQRRTMRNPIRRVADRLPAASRAKPTKLYAPRRRARRRMRPRNLKDRSPAPAFTENLPRTRTQRTQRGRERLRRVAARQRPRTRRPVTRRSTLNRTRAASESLKRTREPTRAATLGPERAALKRRVERRRRVNDGATTSAVEAPPVVPPPPVTPVAVNCAVTARAALIVTTHVPVPPQSPVHPANREPVAGVAVSVTVVPFA